METASLDILNSFDSISLNEMDNVKLLNRVDSKYVLSKKEFLIILSEITSEYRVLTIDGLKSARYKSLYYDTEKHKFYNDHHRGKVNRFKVRSRNYIDSNLCFFEIKHKKKGRTEKKRMQIDQIDHQIENQSLEFLNKVIKSGKVLKPCLWNYFERVTLVNNERKERLTFDIGLNFTWENKNFEFPEIVIAEVKQETNDRNIPCRLALKKHQIRLSKISKYCIGMGLVYPNLKTNRFKQKYLLINKIQENA